MRGYRWMGVASSSSSMGGAFAEAHTPGLELYSLHPQDSLKRCPNLKIKILKMEENMFIEYTCNLDS